jgi:hypothetical protein
VGAWDVPWFVQGLGAAGATAHANAQAKGVSRPVAPGAAAGSLDGFREALVRFFTEVLAEAFDRVQGRRRGSGDADARAARGNGKRPKARARTKGPGRSGR